jgi:prepilin-type N-terminal cleavage/methylation domain-containing protein
MTRLSFIKIRYAKRLAKGFTLVELVVTIVLVGIIGTFTMFFLYTGLSGYLRAKDTAEGALEAQIALDRISLELRDITDVSAFTANSKIDYTSATLAGSREITYNPITRTIALSVDGNPNPLLLDVTSFAMTASYADLNYYSGGTNEVQAINVAFTVGQIGRQFSTRIFPRNMVAQPP